MRDKIFALLGVESGEESMVSILLTQSVFLGIFFGSFDISAHSLFLSVFDEKMMAKAYVVSGLAGIILTSLYTWLQTRINFRYFASINLFVVTIFTLLLWMGLLITRAEWIVFLVFIMLGPLNILAALGFWGTAGRLFSLRQGKRLFGLVDSGLIVGIIISCYTIPVVLSFNFASHNILLISTATVFIATIIQVITGSKFKLVSTERKSEGRKEKPSVFSILRKDRYITIMAVFVALSVMTAFFVQYSFMAVTRQQYPAEEDMARFLGIFTGSMMIFTLLVKLLAFSYLIKNYGLKISLVISPVLISVLVAVAILVGLAMGYTPAAASGFLIFFLVLALGRLFSKSLKDSIESPSFKVIYQTLDEKIRYEVQSAMDGTVNEIAALSSGLILAGLGMLSFIKLIHFSFVLFFIILLWISVAFMLYSEYRKSIRRALESTTPTEAEPVVAEGIRIGSRFTADISFRKDYFNLITRDPAPLGNNAGRLYLERIINHSAENRDSNLIPVLRMISGDNTIDAEVRQSSEKAIREVESFTGSASAGKIAHALKLLSGSRMPQAAEILRLLRDNSVESRRYALFIIGKFHMSDMLTEVCHCLSNPALETDAISVLTSFGGEAAEELQRYYMAISGNSCTGASVLRILGKTPGKNGSSFLFSRLWSPSRRIKETAVKGLIENGYSPSAEDRDRLHQLISDTIALMTWNISARVCLQKHGDKKFLEILDKDIFRWKKFLFDLLSIAYDKSSIGKIRENLEKDTVESSNFALEMIDIVIDESIKPKIIALLDMVPDENRLRNLWHFFPGEVPSYNKLIDDIINRDYNLVSLWTKACTLRGISKINDDNLAQSVCALLFSPENIMQEEAANTLSRSDNGIFSRISGRIPESTYKRVEPIIAHQKKPECFLFEKVLFLASLFKSIPEEELLILAEKLIHADVLPTGATCAPECIVWNLGESEKKADIKYGGGEGKLSKGSYYVLPLTAIEEFNRQYPESATEIFTYIDLNEAQN